MICFGWFQILTNMKMYDQINFGYLSIYLKFFLRKYHVHKYKTHHVGSQKPYFSCNNHLHLEYLVLAKLKQMAINSWVRQVQEVETQDQSEFEVQIQIQCLKWRFKSSIPEFFIFLDSKFSGLKSSWIHIFLNEFFIEESLNPGRFHFKKVSIQENRNSGKCEFKEVWNPRKFQFKKMKNSRMLDLNLDFEPWNWIWT